MGGAIALPRSRAYKARNNAYFSLSSQKNPYYIVKPRNTEEVAKVIKILASNPGCNFAIRSGGHSVSGGSNIDDGITVDLGAHMKSCWYDAKTRLVSIQPGGTWGDVYAALEPKGVMVAGARSHNVGIAGLLTGGGLSWFTPRVGFCCDQVVNVEVVLADGSVVEANKNQNADLWRAIKGAGAGNFGVVTRFDLATISCDFLWGGMLVSDKSTTQEHIVAMRNYTERLEHNPDSSYFAMWNYDPTTSKDIVIAIFGANTRGIMNAPELREIMKIPRISGGWKMTTMEKFSRQGDLPTGY